MTVERNWELAKLLAFVQELMEGIDGNGAKEIWGEAGHGAVIYACAKDGIVTDVANLFGHAVAGHHGPGDVGDPGQVVGGTGGAPAADAKQSFKLGIMRTPYDWVHYLWNK